MTIESTSSWRFFDAHQWREQVLASSAQTAITECSKQIAKSQEEWNLFTDIAPDILQQAAALDELPESERGVLHGVPVVVKDENDVTGFITGYGTKANKTVAESDSLTVARLRAAGAIIIGKTTMPALGAFPFTESDAYGITRNPLNPAYTPGGSSGGSAVAVAGGLVPLALGGDGGGSIRIPADRCGIFGLKPTRNLVSAAPKKHLWFKLGSAGPLARSMRDIALATEVIAGLSPTTLTRYLAQNLADNSDSSKPLANLRVGLVTKPTSPLARLHTEHLSATTAVAAQLRALGAQVVPVKRALPDPTMIFLVQFFAGLRETIAGLEDKAKLEKLHHNTARLGFFAKGKVLRWSLQAAQKYADKLQAKFADFDLLLTPTTAGRPATVGSLQKRGGFFGAVLRAIPSVAYTVPANVSGHAALALPAGIAKDGLPLSVQLIAINGRKKFRALLSGVKLTEVAETVTDSGREREKAQESEVIAEVATTAEAEAVLCWVGSHLEKYCEL